MRAVSPDSSTQSRIAWVCYCGRMYAKDRDTGADAQRGDPASDLPAAAAVVLVACAVAATLAMLALIACSILDGLNLASMSSTLLLTLGAVLVAGVLVVPLLVAIVWSAALAVTRAERPVRTAFKGVFGFIHQIMQIVSIPLVP